MRKRKCIPDRETELAKRLGYYAITEEYDSPSDVPEFCGWWCNECKTHIEASGSGHAAGCLCYGIAPMTDRALRERASAPPKGEE
jgi:hypothetical protein